MPWLSLDSLETVTMSTMEERVTDPQILVDLKSYHCQKDHLSINDIEIVSVTEGERAHCKGKLLFSVHIGNMPLSIEKRQLERLFGRFGTIGESWVYPVDNEMRHTYGFVRFFEEEDARKSIQEMNNHVICGHKLVVAFSKSTRSCTSETGRGRSGRDHEESRHQSQHHWHTTSDITSVEDQEFQEALLLSFEDAYSDTHGIGAVDNQLCESWNSLMRNFRTTTNSCLPPRTFNDSVVSLDLKSLRVCDDKSTSLSNTGDMEHCCREYCECLVEKRSESPVPETAIAKVLPVSGRDIVTEYMAEEHDHDKIGEANSGIDCSNQSIPAALYPLPVANAEKIQTRGRGIGRGINLDILRKKSSPPGMPGRGKLH